MDWADDVTYAVHDMDDFYRAGLVPLERLSDPDDEDAQGLLIMFAGRTVRKPLPPRSVCLLRFRSLSHMTVERLSG